jgi:hypothetical protein
MNLKINWLGKKFKKIENIKLGVVNVSFIDEKTNLKNMM